MTTSKSTLLPITITPGVQPSTDKTAFATPHFTQADKIRFRFGFPQKIGGWASLAFDYGATISGYARSIFSTILSTAVNIVIGTNTKFYTLSGTTLINITPLQTATTAIANSLATDYGTLANNPITTVNGSGTVTIADTNAPKYISGDTITLSGVPGGGVNGITAAQLNIALKIHTIGASSYTVITAGTATSSGAGGSNAVVRATGRITVTATAHGMPNGNRVLIAAAVAAGGVTALQINGEWIIRNVATNTFDIATAGTATSSVSGAGGAGTTFQPEIATGNQDVFSGVGYGMGKFGVGLYGTALKSSSTLSYPRIWFFDRFGANIIGTAGNQTGVYSWAGSTATAPTLVTNAPTAVSYAFVSDNILVTFGAGGTVNRVFASDQGNMTQWTGSSTNQVFDYTINGASQLISHVPISGINLIFSAHQTYTFQYIGLPGVWAIKKIEDNIGIIGPMARCSIGGVAYWMDTNNFYMWAGGNVTIIPANTQQQSTIHNYVFGNINNAQAWKSFAWFNEQFDEIWFHYPSTNSNEPNMVARYNRVEQHWTPDTFDRLCAEYPNLTTATPHLISSTGKYYAHEQGNDADGSAMAWSLTSNIRGGSNIMQRAYGIMPKETTLLTGFVPDSVQTGNINVEIIAKLYPQSPTNTYDQNYTVTPTTPFVPVESGGRLWQYKLSGNTLGQQFIGGAWHEYVQSSSPQ